MNEARELLRLSDVTEVPLQASKWLQVQALLDDSEMDLLFQALGDFYLFRAGAICLPGEEEISKEEFLDKYRSYIAQLKKGELPEENAYRAYFSSILSVAKDHLFQIPVNGGRALIRLSRPVIQLQLCRIAYSEIDGKFYPMVFGQGSFFLGIAIFLSSAFSRCH